MSPLVTFSVAQAEQILVNRPSRVRQVRLTGVYMMMREDDVVSERKR